MTARVGIPVLLQIPQGCTPSLQGALVQQSGPVPCGLCPVPTYLFPVYLQLQAPAAEREWLVLEGRFCWKVKNPHKDAAKSLDVLREMQTRVVFWTYRGVTLTVKSNSCCRTSLRPVWTGGSRSTSNPLGQGSPGTSQLCTGDKLEHMLSPPCPGFCWKQHGDWAENCHVLRARWQHCGEIRILTGLLMQASTLAWTQTGCVRSI